MSDRLRLRDDVGLVVGWDDRTPAGGPLGPRLEATLQYFQREGATIAVVRERETPVGIVTVEDVLEQVVGRIEDEYPRHPRLDAVPRVQAQMAPAAINPQSPLTIIDVGNVVDGVKGFAYPFAGPAACP